MGVVTPALAPLCPRWPSKGLAREQKGGGERGSEQGGQGPRWQDTVPPQPGCRAEPMVAAQVPSRGGQAEAR